MAACRQRIFLKRRSVCGIARTGIDHGYAWLVALHQIMDSTGKAGGKTGASASTYASLVVPMRGVVCDEVVLGGVTRMHVSGAYYRFSTICLSR